MTCDSKINLFKNGQHWEQRQRPRKKRKPWMNPGARECRLANPERDYLNTKHTPRENLMVHPLQKRCLQKTTYPYCDTKMSAYRFVNTTF